ncbi:hypothetical protein [Pseudomonas protegens]|uniref:hypothetical protein n=1 Tax=Pseudomonas protegens TaxID=380021 RepID=UPI00274BB8A8|nr:hypothetical protein [Pseudomonas protegens]MDP9518806.1 hypothetical protein [Pseudomonas protegens]
MNTISVGRFFIAQCQQPAGAPLVDRGFTNERGDLGGRRGDSLVFRSLFGKGRACKALAIGLWRK